MRRLLLVRHGETTWNADGRYQGQRDVPLNAVGRRQAAAVARRLAREALTAIYASDLCRARETAEIIAAQCGLPVRTDPRLREINFGHWQGLSHAEVLNRYPDEVAAWYADPLHEAVHGGETLQQVASRLEELWEELWAAHWMEDVLLVGHGGTLQVLLCLLLGKPVAEFSHFKMGNVALSVLTFLGGRPHLVTFNDRRHWFEKANGRCVSSKRE